MVSPEACYLSDQNNVTRKPEIVCNDTYIWHGKWEDQMYN